jgi:hypothetical protein
VRFGGLWTAFAAAEKPAGGYPWLVTASIALGVVAATAAALVLWAHS